MPSKATPSARRRDTMRSTTIEPVASAAAGSVIITQGRTRVLCTASISTKTPPWLNDPETGEPTRGWVTAEYAMMPGSTPERQRRGPTSRGTEIQRLIGRSLRAAVDLEKMPGLAITCDCDVLVADGGTRTASITGAWVALAHALAHAREAGLITASPLLGPVAAVSVGVVRGQIHLDLDYDLDSTADVDMNVVMNHQDRYVELQGTGEAGTFDADELAGMLELARRGIRKLMTAQRAAIRGKSQ
ncbi:MAG: ribonuclease PH [Phycisphaeraceae bacterium]